jgi:hypothetical protein
MNTTPVDLSQPPLQEFSWDTTLKDVLLSVYVMNSELTGNEPRCLRLSADRIQVNWQQSGLVDGSEQSVIEMAFTCRPVEPGSIVLNVPEIVAPTITALSPNTGPANTDIPVLTITGTGFNSGSIVQFGTARVNPDVISPTTLECHIGAVNVEFLGTIEVSVVNSDGQTSGQLPFTVT